MHNQQFCGCGQSFLSDGVTRIRHILSCFFGGHNYTFLGTRQDHDEYMCTRCGHPLMFRAEENAFAGRRTFKKKVRYFCNLFGHRVHLVIERQSLWEHACFCGHSFLKKERNLKKITHPLLCTIAGHFIERIDDRENCSEFVCTVCGHTFLFRFTSSRHCNSGREVLDFMMY